MPYPLPCEFRPCRSQRLQPRLDPDMMRFQEWRQRQAFAEVRRVFVGGKAGTDGLVLT
jgi:hypothetical protein